MDGWSSVEDCFKDCPQRQEMEEHQYWEDKDTDMDWEADRRTPPTKEEILSQLPSGKHTKNLRETAVMTPEDFDEEILQDQEEQDLMKMPHKDRKHY